MSTEMETIRAFLGKLIRVDQVGNDDDLFGRGLLNSLNAVQLIAFVEKEFEMKVEDADLDPENFQSIAALARFVQRKTARGS